MSETTFARQFLTTLDAKPPKYQPSHIFDPKTFALRIPYTLPKLPNPPHPPPPKPTSTTSSTAAPGSEPVTPTVTIVLKSSRNPNLLLTLPSLNPTETTIQSLKESIQSHLGGPTVVAVEKIKILHNKKPIPSAKRTVRDALSDSLGLPAGGQVKGDVEFGVMIMGGAPDPPAQPQQQQEGQAKGSVVPEEEKGVEDTPSAPMEGVESSAPVQPGEASGKDVLESTEFWEDLQGFLEQRLKDQKEAVRLREVFEKSWRSSVSAP